MISVNGEDGQSDVDIRIIIVNTWIRLIRKIVFRYSNILKCYRSGIIKQKQTLSMINDMFINE